MKEPERAREIIITAIRNADRNETPGALFDDAFLELMDVMRDYLLRVGVGNEHGFEGLSAEIEAVEDRLVECNIQAKNPSDAGGLA